MKNIRYCSEYNTSIKKLLCFCNRLGRVPSNTFLEGSSNEKIVTANNTIKNIANRNGCVYIDVHQLYIQNGEMNASLSRDGVHLLPESYGTGLIY